MEFDKAYIAELLTRELKDNPNEHVLMALPWENAYENAIEHEELIFIYRGVIRKGYLDKIFVRPVKYKWVDTVDIESCYLDMEELEYDNDDCRPIVFWLPFNKFPKYLYSIIGGYECDEDLLSKPLSNKEIKDREFTIGFEILLTKHYKKSVLDDEFDEEENSRSDNTREQ